VLRGHATSGRARGRAFVVRALAAAPSALPPGAVLVVPAILPSLAYLLPGARALVTDHGGVTSHGATLAREYGVPAVLGAAGATQLPDGADLYVDAAAGRVYVIS
jgi:pyruvate,water dikinase